MKKYAYMKCLFSSIAVVFGIYWAAGFYGHSSIGRADAQTCADVNLQAETEAAVTAELESQVTLESESQMVALPEEIVPEAVTEPTEKPVVEASRELFGDALFIGDSRTVGLMEYGDLGEAEVFANTGLTVFEALKASIKTSTGKKQTLEEVLQSRTFGKIYIMLGLNELGYPYDSIVKQYGKSLLPLTFIIMIELIS